MDDLAAELVPAFCVGLAHRVIESVCVGADSKVGPNQSPLPYHILYLCAGLCFFWNGRMETD